MSRDEFPKRPRTRNVKVESGGRPSGEADHWCTNFSLKHSVPQRWMSRDYMYRLQHTFSTQVVWWQGCAIIKKHLCSRTCTQAMQTTCREEPKTKNRPIIGCTAVQFHIYSNYNACNTLRKSSIPVKPFKIVSYLGLQTPYYFPLFMALLHTY